MRKYLFILMLCAMTLACNKTRTDDPDAPKGMEFRASASATKSHFESDDPSNTNLQLYWDAYDNLAVYSVDPSDPTGSVVSGSAYIQPGDVGKSSALFRSYKQEDEWYKKAATDGTKHFFAYYPAPAPNDFVIEDGEPAMMVHLESSQYRSDFGSYQMMISRGGTYSPGEQVEFNDFTPATALLKFQLKMDQGYDYAIQNITVEPMIYTYWIKDEPDNYGYYSDIVTSQTLDTETGNYINNYEYAERLVGLRYIKLSSILSGGPLEWGRYDYSQQFEESDSRYTGGYFPYEWSTLYVYSESDSSEPYSLNGDAGDVLYAVVFPTTNYPSRGEYALRINARYDVRMDGENYGYSYSVDHEGYIRIPRPGFEAGKRYDFVLTLTQDELKVTLTNKGIDFSYDVVNW